MVGTVSVQKSSKHLFTSMNNSPLLDISECQCIGHLETLAVQCPRVISGSCTLIADFFKHPRSKRLMAFDSKRNIVSGPLENFKWMMECLWFLSDRLKNGHGVVMANEICL